MVMLFLEVITVKANLVGKNFENRKRDMGKINVLKKLIVVSGLWPTIFVTSKNVLVYRTANVLSTKRGIENSIEKPLSTFIAALFSGNIVRRYTRSRNIYVVRVFDKSIFEPYYKADSSDLVHLFARRNLFLYLNS